MRASRSVEIDAPTETVYALAQDVARWPEILPHYRWVRVVSEGTGERIVEMAARRDFIPVRWTARQTLDPVTPRIGFTHLSGWTKGMQVAWLFDRRGARTAVTIVHELAAFSIGGAWFARRVIGDFFIQSIAGKTLARMKELAEKQHA